MSIISTSSYTFDAAKIQLVGGVARLIVPQTSGTILINQVFQVATFTSMTETVAKSGADDIKYHLKVSGAFKYWNGSAWVASDQSFAQSSTVAQINANAASLVTVTNQFVQLQAILKGSGTTSPELDQLIVNYDVGAVFDAVTGYCTVYCYLSDILGDLLSETTNAASLIAVNDKSFTNHSNIIAPFYKSAPFTSSDVGLIASLSLSETDTVNHKIRFMINYLPYGVTSKTETIYLRACVVPNQAVANITDITSVNTNQLL